MTKTTDLTPCPRATAAEGYRYPDGTCTSCGEYHEEVRNCSRCGDLEREGLVDNRGWCEPCQELGVFEREVSALVRGALADSPDIDPGDLMDYVAGHMDRLSPPQRKHAWRIIIKAVR
jgi:hypothetical protein